MKNFKYKSKNDISFGDDMTEGYDTYRERLKGIGITVDDEDRIISQPSSRER